MLPPSSRLAIAEGTELMCVTRFRCGLSRRWTALSSNTTPPPRESGTKNSMTARSKQIELTAATPLRSHSAKIRSASDSIAAQLLCLIGTPLGRPVEPEV